MTWSQKLKTLAQKSTTEKTRNEIGQLSKERLKSQGYRSSLNYNVPGEVVLNENIKKSIGEEQEKNQENEKEKQRVSERVVEMEDRQKKIQFTYN